MLHNTVRVCFIHTCLIILDHKRDGIFLIQFQFRTVERKGLLIAVVDEADAEDSSYVLVKIINSQVCAY